MMDQRLRSAPWLRLSALASIAPVALILSAALLLACSPNESDPDPAAPAGEYGTFSPPSEMQDAEWSPVIAAHTRGPISRTSDIQVRFVKQQVEDSKVGRKIEDAPIQFEPPIEGIATWKTTQELR
ncbi:MAG: hypothetical protein AB8G23_24155, partial [Myxococcota bacterium]